MFERSRRTAWRLVAGLVRGKPEKPCFWLRALAPVARAQAPSPSSARLRPRPSIPSLRQARALLILLSFGSFLGRQPFDLNVLDGIIGRIRTVDDPCAHWSTARDVVRREQRGEHNPIGKEIAARSIRSARRTCSPQESLVEPCRRHRALRRASASAALDIASATDLSGSTTSFPRVASAFKIASLAEKCVPRRTGWPNGSMLCAGSAMNQSPA